MPTVAVIMGGSEHTGEKGGCHAIRTKRKVPGKEKNAKQPQYYFAK
jgi:hypothetical protein